MVKEVLPFTAGVLLPFQEKNDDILKLKLMILIEMFEIWICIAVIARLLILLVL